MTGADGVEREIEVTAFPLFAHSDEFVGIVVIFGLVLFVLTQRSLVAEELSADSYVNGNGGEKTGDG